jgi:putative transposase
MSAHFYHPAAMVDAKSLCYVVMPDHFHLLLQLENTSLDKVMNRIKSRSAVLLNRTLGLSGRFWQPGFHERALRQDEDLQAMARYVVANPLRAGMVRKLANYPYWNAIWL